jgi:DNA-directed RNA polymerase subunit K/omega
MSDDERYVSDNESDFGDYTDDVADGAAEDAAEEVPISDVNNELDNSDNESFEDSEPEDNIKDNDTDDITEQVEEDFEEEEEPIDLKSVSNHNREIIIVKPENRRTSHIMSKYEMTEYITIRATQISQHNNCMVDITGLDDPIKMAKRELMMRKCPLKLRRHVGDIRDPKTSTYISYYEDWSPAELQFATTYLDVL